MADDATFDPEWDPSKEDWAAGSSSADDQDEEFDLDDEDDSMCVHPWHDLDFLDGLGDPTLTGAIGCSSCGQVWEAGNDDAVSTVWNSAKMAIVTSFTRMAAIEDVLRKKLDMARCAVCGHWDDRHLLVDLGPRTSCSKHVAEAVGDPTDDAVPLLRALDWSRAAGLPTSEDPLLRVRWEHMVASSAELAAAAGDDDGEAGLSRPVDLGDAANMLGLPRRTSLHSVALAVASRCDLDPPVSRLASAYLLALVNVSKDMHEGTLKSDDSSVDEAIDASLPFDEDLCVAISVELCFPGVPDGVEFHGDMADEALRLSSRRVIETLNEKWKRTF